MNLIYHAAVGIVGDVALDAKGVFFIGSIWPDLTLLYNEIKIRVTGKPFNPYEVDRFSVNFYRLTHSSLITFLLCFINYNLSLAHLVHMFFDWFTHTGRFATMPLFPFTKYKISFGKEILK